MNYIEQMLARRAVDARSGIRVRRETKAMVIDRPGATSGYISLRSVTGSVCSLMYSPGFSGDVFKHAADMADSAEFDKFMTLYDHFLMLL